MFITAANPYQKSRWSLLITRPKHSLLGQMLLSTPPQFEPALLPTLQPADNRVKVIAYHTIHCHWGPCYCLLHFCWAPHYCSLYQSQVLIYHARAKGYQVLLLLHHAETQQCSNAKGWSLPLCVRLSYHLWHASLYFCSLCQDWNTVINTTSVSAAHASSQRVASPGGLPY